MAKELPYFRFTVQEWQNGGISTLNDSLKGVFIDICAFYWAQNCNVTFETLSNKFKTKSKSIQKLIVSQTIYNQNGIVSISFLDQQLSELKQTKSFFSEMGKLGQKAKKSKAPLKTDLSYKDNIKENKDNIKEFDLFRSQYPGTKRGLELEFENFKKKNQNFKEIIPLLLTALEKEIHWRQQKKSKSLFVAEWKHLQTWINNRCWEQEFEEIPKPYAPPLKPKDFDINDHLAHYQAFGYEEYCKKMKELDEPIRLNPEGFP